MRMVKVPTSQLQDLSIKQGAFNSTRVMESFSKRAMRFESVNAFGESLDEAEGA
jgi:hypothetical protein